MAKPGVHYYLKSFIGQAKTSVAKLWPYLNEFFVDMLTLTEMDISILHIEFHIVNDII